MKLLMPVVEVLPIVLSVYYLQMLKWTKETLQYIHIYKQHVEIF